MATWQSVMAAGGYQAYALAFRRTGSQVQAFQVLKRRFPDEDTFTLRQVQAHALAGIAAGSPFNRPRRDRPLDPSTLPNLTGSRPNPSDRHDCDQIYSVTVTYLDEEGNRATERTFEVPVRGEVTRSALEQAAFILAGTVLGRTRDTHPGAQQPVLVPGSMRVEAAFRC